MGLVAKNSQALVTQARCSNHRCHIICVKNAFRVSDTDKQVLVDFGMPLCASCGLR